MGAEFLRRTKPTIIKSVDMSRAALATHDLFTRTPASLSRTAIVSLDEANTVRSGEQVIVEINKNEIIITKNGAVAGKFLDLPQQLIDAIHFSCGTALGEVIRVYPISKTAEVTLS